ncbi:hypothetical protein UPYG_G00244180 [Umbra pygmaea]|uniref:Uncharacterized protein n=1 Tax=Umbra pygmaea TaxID=75934 RepID=A0ABD0X068_UMBPY
MIVGLHVFLRIRNLRMKIYSEEMNRTLETKIIVDRDLWHQTEKMTLGGITHHPLLLPSPNHGETALLRRCHHPLLLHSTDHGETALLRRCHHPLLLHSTRPTARLLFCGAAITLCYSTPPTTARLLFWALPSASATPLHRPPASPLIWKAPVLLLNHGFLSDTDTLEERPQPKRKASVQSAHPRKRPQRVTEEEDEESWHNRQEQDEQPDPIGFLPTRPPGPTIDTTSSWTPLLLFQLFLAPLYYAPSLPTQT